MAGIEWILNIQIYGIRDLVMDTAMDRRLFQGLNELPQLPDLSKDELDEEMRAVYDDIERTLRVPFVNFIFRSLANFPEYFVPAWKALSPHLRRVECERAGQQLRGLAANEIAVEPFPKNILSIEDHNAIAAFTDSIHYVLPKLLLTATALDMQASGDFVIRPEPSAGDVTTIPYGIAQGTGPLPLLDPADADDRVRALFKDIQEQHGHPGVASYYRGLGHYPVFLGQAWQEVRRHVDTNHYRQRKQALLAFAETYSIRELVSRARTPMTAAPDSVRAILAVFRYRLIPDLLLDVTLIQAMFDGPHAAAHSRFTVT
jgi:hypothetical protein